MATLQCISIQAENLDVSEDDSSKRLKESRTTKICKYYISISVSFIQPGGELAVCTDLLLGSFISSLLHLKMTRSMACMLAMAITMITVAYGDVPDCSDVIGKLTPCLSYIQMQVAEPSSDCCKGLSYAHTNKPVCLCQILDSQSSSSSGSGLNTSAAMMLPTMCKVNADAKRCPALLGQSAAPPEAHKSNASNHVPSVAATAAKGTTQSNSSLQLVPCALLFVALALLQHFV